MRPSGEINFLSRVESDDHVAVLLAEIVKQDPIAFRLLYKMTSKKLFGIVFNIVRNKTEAEDVLQDIYLKVWMRAHKYNDEYGRAISWLFAVSKNQALSHLRARRHNHTGEQKIIDELPDHGQNVEALIIVADDARWVMASLQMLKPEMALAVQEAYISGLSYAELAKRHNVPINTMRTRLRRGRLKIKEAYDVRSA